MVGTSAQTTSRKSFNKVTFTFYCAWRNYSGALFSNKKKQKNLILSAGANATHDVVYQDEEGQWVTDLAYYSSFQKEADKASEDAAQLQSEEFVAPGVYPGIIGMSNI